MAQQSHQPPSTLLQVNEWVKRHYGHDGWWTCIQVDHAVMMFGTRVESLLNGFDKKGKPKHKLDDLLRVRYLKHTDKPVTQISRLSPIISPKPTRKQKKSEHVASNS